MAGKGGHRGFGHVRRLPSRRWQASYNGADHARHAAPFTFDTREDAEGWLSAERALSVTDEWVPPKLRAERKRHDAFGSYAEAWLVQRQVRGRPLKPRTVAHYRRLLDRAILPTFAGLPVRHINAAAVRVWRAGLDPATPTWNAHTYSLLKAICETAVDDGILTANPCRERGAGQARRATTTRPATLDQLAVIVETSPTRYRLMVLFAAWCAMRYGELIELRRSDIDAKNGIIHVRRAVAWVGGEPMIGAPKSDAGTRDVTIPPHLMSAVRAHLRAMPMSGRDTLLFPSSADPRRQMRQSTLQRWYYPARAAAGRTDLRFHDLRHTGAVLAAQTGATLAELMARLGHSTPAAAMRYQHAAQGRDAIIAARLSEMANSTRSNALPT